MVYRYILAITNVILPTFVVSFDNTFGDEDFCSNDIWHVALTGHSV